MKDHSVTVYQTDSGIVIQHGNRTIYLSEKGSAYGSGLTFYPYLITPDDHWVKLKNVEAAIVFAKSKRDMFSKVFDSILESLK